MSAFNDTAVPPGVLERARAGDEAAWEAIYRAFEQPVRTLARRILAHRSAAEDVAQDVFVDVLTRLHQYEGRGSFAGWVRSIAVTRCLIYLRSPWQRGRSWLARRDEDAGGWPVEEWQVALEGGVPQLTDRSDSLDLERALRRLGDTARAVVWLHDVEGYTHAEIGALFGASASFSKSQLARAHERLRDWLQVEGVGSPCIPVSSTS